jgi:hypothetical protein
MPSNSRRAKPIRFRKVTLAHPPPNGTSIDTETFRNILNPHIHILILIELIDTDTIASVQLQVAGLINDFLRLGKNFTGRAPFWAQFRFPMIDNQAMRSLIAWKTRIGNLKWSMQ